MAIRLTDLLQPEYDGLKEVVDLSPEGELSGRLRLPEGLAVRTAIGEDALGAGALLLLKVSADDLGPTPQGAARAALSRLEPGGRAALVVDGPIDRLPVGALVDLVVSRSCQVVDHAPVSLPGSPVALLVERVDELRPTRGYLRGRGDAPAHPAGEQATFASGLRLAAETALESLQLRAARTRVDELEGRVRDTEGKLAEAKAELQARTDALTRERDALSARVTTLEESEALRAGRVVVQAARSPRRALRVPGELARIRRDARRSKG